MVASAAGKCYMGLWSHDNRGKFTVPGGLFKLNVEPRMTVSVTETDPLFSIGHFVAEIIRDFVNTKYSKKAIMCSSDRITLNWVEV